ncbi:MAG: hypothetical protein HXX16_13680 [Bacteroidales bacterium]|nr:hypothetical protein [Bacteroidales bacterium]
MSGFKLSLMTFSISLALCTNLHAQEKNFIPNFIPPSPTAYELGRYGQIPVGMFTGTPNINIPLYEYKTKNLSVPISLNYNSNGIKVDQIETNVGLGWSLNAGGVISRIIRDKPDEKYLAYYPESQISNMQDPVTTNYFWEVGQGLTDIEPDLFMFNFMGHSGKFVFDKDKNIVLMPYQDLLIKPYVDDNHKGYLITTSDGVKYYFWDIERTTSYVEGGGHSENRNEESAWYLSKIVHPLGDEVYFTYGGQGYTYTTGLSQTYKVYPSLGDACTKNHPMPLLTTFTNNTTITGRKLDGISSNNPFNGEVIITSGETNPGIPGYNLISNISVKNKDYVEIEKFDFQYLTTTNKRKFLQKITYKDQDKTYQFQYDNPEDLPERLAYSQDHWGYFNGKQNTMFVPKLSDDATFMYLDGANKEPDGAYSVKGLLTQVTYPTKGYTQLTYEPNSYYGGKVINGQPISVTLNASQGLHGYNNVTQTFTSTHNQRVYISTGVSFNQGCNDTTHTPTIDISIRENSSNTIVPLKIISASLQEMDWSGQYTPSDNGMICFADLGIGDYTFNLTAYSCSVGSSTLIYRDQVPQSVMGITETGGQRVKRVVAHDPVNNQDNTTRYYYGSMDNLNQPIADDGAKAFYLSSNYETEACDQSSTLTFIRPILVLSSSSLTSLFNTGNNNIYYQYVTLSQGGDNFENGGEQHEFILHRDSPGYQKWGKDISGAPWTNFGWDNGLEKQVKVFRKDGSDFKVIQETTNHFIPDMRKYREVIGYSVRKNFEPMLNCIYPSYTCTSEDVIKPNLGTYPGCDALHEHNFFEGKCIAPGNIYATRYIPNPCYGLASNTHIVLQIQCIDNLDIMEYKNLSYWSYLDSTVNKQFDANGANPVTNITRYYYDNPSHIQLTRTETTGSDGKTIVTKTHYPDDDLTSLGFTTTQNQLIKRLGGGKNGLHRIAEPVQTEQLIDGNITSTQRTLYKDWIQNGDTLILPEIIQTSTRGSSLENRARYGRYDEHGNPLEVLKENDVVSSYYWGYGNRYPVAKVDNISYNILATAIQNSLPAGFTSLDGLLSAIITTGASDSRWALFNKNLRANSTLSGRMITTYTYSPMIGITSQTDPNGIITYYEYDSNGRLYQIKDHEGNILKRYDYNYSHQ